ncbi:MAG: DUF4336 domain-containing protein [Cyanobacteria bacterium P01_A01_bin.135]
MTFRPVPPLASSGLAAVASEIWTIEASKCVCYRPPAQPRYPYTHRAIVIRLQGRELFVLSPIQLTPEIRTAVDRLGRVAYLVSPNNLHHLYLGDWSQAYPAAKIYGSPGLAAKRKDLSFETIIETATPEPEWAGQIDQCIFGTGRGFFDEVVFFHRGSRTLIFTDTIMDFDSEVFSPLAKVTTRLNQMYRHTPRGVQLAHLFDRKALHQALATIRGWDAEHVVVAHSPWLCVDGAAAVSVFLDQAFDWLAPKPAAVEAIAGMVRLLVLFGAVLPVHVVVVLFADILYPRLAASPKQ